MKKIILLIALTIFLIVSINLVLGELEFWQQKTDIGNGTIKNHLVVFYSKNKGVADDYVSGNNPFDTYLLYNIYVQKWNTDNPNYKADRCEFIVKFLGHLENSSTIILNQSYTQADADTMSAKYFIRLNDGDGMIADEICYFENQNYQNLDIPAEMQLVTPTWECKACQYYEWSLVEGDVLKAQSIGNNVVTVSEYIKKLFLLNFEIILALFWIFLILMIFIAISLIFMTLYWLFIYLRRIAK